MKGPSQVVQLRRSRGVTAWNGVPTTQAKNTSWGYPSSKSCKIKIKRYFVTMKPKIRERWTSCLSLKRNRNHREDRAKPPQTPWALTLASQDPGHEKCSGGCCRLYFRPSVRHTPTPPCAHWKFTGPCWCPGCARCRPNHQAPLASGGFALGHCACADWQSAKDYGGQGWGDHWIPGSTVPQKGEQAKWSEVHRDEEAE